MKKFYVLSLILCSLIVSGIKAQVSLTATAGTPTGLFTTLKGAFDAINAGTHQGAIVISIIANTTEGATPATLNSSGAGSASFTSVLIQPGTDGVSISGNPVTGFGVIQLNGADNVTIDGDNPNTGGTNRNLTINNTTTNTVIANSCIRIATSAAVLSADNNIIRNCICNGNVTAGNAVGITLSTSSSNSSFGIYCGGNGGATSTGAPTAITSVTTNSAPSGTTINNLIIDNNAVNQCARGIVFIGAASTVSSAVTITNNLVGDQATTLIGLPPYTTPTTTVYTKGIYIAGTNAITIMGNTVKNIVSYVGTGFSAIELNTAIGTGTININNNTVKGVVNNGTASSVNGILISNAGGPYSVSGNTVSNIQVVGSLTITGAITLSASTGTATVERNNVFTVYSRGTTTSGAYGINLTTGNNAVIRNNFVSDISHNMTSGAAFSTTTGIFGIRIASGTGHKIYHNSVNLSGLMLGTSSATQLTAAFGITTTTITGMDVRNNIFSNTITGGTTSIAHVAVFLPSAATFAMNLVLNNNAYYVNAGQGLAQAGTTAGTNFFLASNFTNTAASPAVNFRTYSSSLSLSFGNDSASKVYTTAAPFVSSTDLHIPAATATQLESGGASLGVTTDIDGQTRPGPTNVNGGGTSVDIGADEFDGTPKDEIAPVINYAPIPFTCSTGDRTVAGINITDATGVPTIGALVPRIYYKKFTAGAWFSQPGTLSSGTGTNGLWSFNIVATDMGGLVLSDSVYYYIIAQDVAATPNIGSNGGGVVATNVIPITTHPTLPSGYKIVAALSGNYLVGLGQVLPNFSTLSAAINAYNTSCISGPVTFLLTDATYTEGVNTETNPYPALLSNGTASSVNTLTIKPNTGVTSTITGPATTILKLNGADYVIIDGSNSGTTSRDLTIATTNATSSGSIVWLGSASVTDGATNDTVRNCNVTGFSIATPANANPFGIISTSGTTLGATASETANSYNAFINNAVSRTKDGIVVVGPALPATGDLNVAILNNNVGSTVAANKLLRRGIWASNQNNVLISKDTVAGISNIGVSLTAQGIFMDGNTTNAVVSLNRLSDIKCDAQIADGVESRSSSTAANISIYNNFIYDLNTFGSTVSGGPLNNTYGILLFSGGGYKIYHNTVNITQSQTVAGSISAGMFVNSSVTTPASVDFRNNILVNNATPSVAYSQYGIYSQSPSIVFSAINNNDYYTYNNTVLGYINNSDRYTLADFQNGFGSNTNSISVLPVFVSATDLHLNPVGSAALNNLGTPIAAVATDIDNQVRDALKPDIGADEFTPANCTVATGGTASIITALPVCVSGPVLMSASGFSAGNQTTYTWQYSNDNFNTDINDITGANNPFNNTATVSQNTFYRLKVACGATSTTDFSIPIQATINNPLVTGTTPAVRCGTGTLTLNATGSLGASLAWYSIPSGGSPLVINNSYTTPSISTTTSYYVSALKQGAVGNLQVGAGLTTSNQSIGNSPFVNQGGSFIAVKTQYIIRASELAAAGIAPGNINSLSLELVNGLGTYSNFEIQIGATNQTTALTSFVTGLTSVFINASYSLPATGIVNYPFSVSYNWDGISNIVLQFCWTATTGASGTVKLDDPGFDYGTTTTDVTTGSAATVCPALSGAIKTTGSGGRPKFLFNAFSRCESNRLSVLATVNTPPPTPVLAGSPGGGAVCQSSTVSGTTDYIASSCNLIATVTPSGATPVAGNINSCVTVDTGANKLGTAPNLNRLFAARYYSIEPATGAASATGTVKFYYKQSEFTNYNLKALDSGYYPLPDSTTLPYIAADSLHVLQFHGTPTGNNLPGNYAGSMVELGPINGVTVAWNVTNSLWEVTVPVNGFSGFFLTSKVRPPLPIKIEYFRGSNMGNAHLLEWKVTPVNTANGKMTLEISADGRSFSPVYTITADAIRMQQPFSYANTRIFDGINYYRMKMVDDNGQVNFSSIVTLLNAVRKVEFIGIAPNPVTNGTSKLSIISSEKVTMTVDILDVTGRLISRQHINLVNGINTIDIDFSQLSNGVYQVVGSTINGNTKVLSIVKQ